MSMNRQTILASRPAAMVLALTLVAGLTAPFLLLPRARAAATPLPCTVGNQNGCTELSPTPPQDTVAVPPNLMLMLDDSGSMRWDVMPDWSFLPAPNWSTLQNNWNEFNDAAVEPLIDSSINGVYYNPSVPYTPPPHADGSLYPQADFGAALVNGFDSGSNAVDLSTYRGRYDSNDASYEASSVQYSIAVAKKPLSSYAPDKNCPSGWGDSSKYPGYCSLNGMPNGRYDFYDTTNGYFYKSRCDSGSDVYDYNGGLSSDKCYPGISFFTYAVSDSSGAFTRHYVAADTGDCAAVGLSSSVCDESAAARQNVANWFSYDHTRILMAKSGLMTAFLNLSSNYRFGFGSINGGNNGQLPSDTVTVGGKTLAEVQPFGDGSSGTQKANFWKWISTLIPPEQGTPLRLSLSAVGKYYQTTQPWTTMSSDPGWTAGSTTQFACRASYTILTTDGFWNGNDPGGIGYAAGSDGPVQTVPATDPPNVTQYLAVPPFSGGGVGGNTPSLADVATYYWAHDLSGMANEVAPSKQDPATWQHMTTFTMGLGFTPTGITPAGTTIPQIFAWAQGGAAIPNFKWPTPQSNGINNISDLAHAALNGHGDFFSAKSPQELAAGFSKAISDINARVVPPTPSAVNASVLTAGALTFETGYNTGDWSGLFKVVELKSDGSAGASVWSTDPDTLLNTDFHGSGYTNRKVYTDSYQSTDPAGKVTGFRFNAAALAASAPNTFDTKEYDPATNTGWLASPVPGGGDDIVANRISYLLGDDEYEGKPTGFRTRSSILGAVINSSPVYVDGAESNYNSNWPSGSAELPPANGGTSLQSYEDFRTQQASVTGMVYVAANDGMLHAFNAPAPVCTSYATDGSGCTPGDWDYGSNPGKEQWAFIPRAVYANLGNLTSATDFSYRPTVDSTPVSRDVYFGESGASNTDNKWHTILTGGVGLGGRGVYALDITSGGASQPKVLWELDSDMTIPATSNCKVVGPSTDAGVCAATDLGFTVAQPNVGRLPDGTWAVIMPNGYFPDCTTPDYPTADITNCQAAAAQAPKYTNGHPYSALFVLDAQTGSVIAEMKTPDIAGVTSFGLATPVMGNLSNNNVDSVAYAGDVEGNLWKFTFGGSGPSDWTVSLVYQAATQGAQPITSMPRLFPDPITNGFMVVFGTGKFLGVGDNSNSTVQSIYAVRDGDPSEATPAGDVVILGGSGTNGLTQNYLHEEVAPPFLPDGITPNPQAGETLRCITGGSGDTCAAPGPGVTNPATAVADSSTSGGWYVNLDVEVASKQTNAGERVVVNPGAIFASNTVVFETLITGSASSDPCSPTTTGAIMALNAVTGAPAGVSSLGGWPIIGGRINNARTSGSLPIVSALGGGQAYLPGTGLAPKGTTPFSLDAPIWRRRSWNEINPNQ